MNTILIINWEGARMFHIAFVFQSPAEYGNIFKLIDAFSTIKLAKKEGNLT